MNFFKELKEDIRLTYGALEDVDENGQGYSYHSYLKTMCKDKEWCDQIIIKAISSMWGAKITVLNADTLYENKYRHDGDPKMLIFVCYTMEVTYMVTTWPV